MRPLALVYGGREHPLDGKWQNLPPVLCRLLDALHPNLLKGFVGAKFIPNLSLDGFDLRRGQEIADLGVWFEKNLSARDFIGQAREMLLAYRVDPAQAAVVMEPRGATARAHAKPCEGTAGGDGLEAASAPGNAIDPSLGRAGRPAPPPALAPADVNAPVPPFGRAGRPAPPPALAPADGGIGAYAKREIYAALAEGRVPDEDFQRLLTLEGTKGIIGMLPHGYPVFALGLAPAGRERWYYWKDCAYRGGVPVFVNSQWMKGRHETYLERLLARWRGASAVGGGGAGRPALPMGVPSLGSAGTRAAVSAPAPADGNAIDSPFGRAVAPRPPLLSDAQRARLAELLEVEFPNGFRLSSYIHAKKMRELHSQRFGDDLPEDLDLMQVMPQIGVFVDGKVFPCPSDKDGGWRKVVDALVEDGNDVFQFSRLMARHADDLMRLGVGSSRLLNAAVVRDAADAYEMKGEFLLRKGVGDVAEHVLGRLLSCDSVVVELKSAAKRLPYVEEVYVKDLLRKDGRFISNSKDEYAVLERIEFDDAEVERGRRLCESCIREDGFFSLAQIVLEDSAAMNDSRLSDFALRHAFYLRFLDGHFARHGRMVHEVGADIQAAAPLRALCRNRDDDVSFDEVDAIATEYRIDIRTALDAVGEERVRVSQSCFVRAELVEFDVEAIDAAISLRMAGAATPVGAFGHFRDFPAVPGCEWNGFLFESYLRSHSRQYRFFALSPSVNEVAGVVAERKVGFADEFDAFAAAAIAADIASEQETVGDFLVSSRCALRRGNKMIEAVVGAMRDREMRAK